VHCPVYDAPVDGPQGTTARKSARDDGGVVQLVDVVLVRKRPVRPRPLGCQTVGNLGTADVELAGEHDPSHGDQDRETHESQLGRTRNVPAFVLTLALNRFAGDARGMVLRRKARLEEMLDGVPPTHPPWTPDKPANH